MKVTDIDGTSSTSSSASSREAGLDAACPKRPARPPRPPRRPKAAEDVSPAVAVDAAPWQEHEAVPPSLCVARPRFGRDVGVVEAISTALCSVLQLKYDLQADPQECATVIRGQCASSKLDWQTQDSETAVAKLLKEINSRDSPFCLHAGGEVRHLITLRLQWRHLPSFKTMVSEVRRTPGTVRVLALVATESEFQQQQQKNIQALAVLRPDYNTKQLLVGLRGFSGGPGTSLHTFNQSQLCTAFVLEPEILQSVPAATADTSGGERHHQNHRRNRPPSASSSPRAAPQPHHHHLREEYVQLGIALGEVTANPSTSSSSKAIPVVASERRPSDAEMASLWPQRLCKLLDKPDGGSILDDAPDQVLTCLRSLLDFLEGASGEPGTSLRSSFFNLKKHTSILNVIQHFSGAAKGVGTELAIVATGCRVIAQSVQEFPAGVAAFAQSEAVVILCSVMREWLMDSEVQQAAMSALRHLLQGSMQQCVAQAVEEGASPLVHGSLAAHPSLAELQRDGGYILEQVSLHQEELSSGSQQPLTGPGRTGLAAALAQRRAGEAGKPGMMGMAVNWLFSGSRDRSRATASSRLSGSAPPGARPPAPLRPPPPAIPHLDLHGSDVLRATERTSAPNSVASSPVGGRPRRGSGARSISAIAQAMRGTPRRADPPFTPSAVRLQERDVGDAVSLRGEESARLDFPTV